MDVLIFSNLAIRTCVSFHDAFERINRSQREIDDMQQRNVEANREAQFHANAHRLLGEAR